MHPNEVVVHQQAENDGFIFLAINLARIFFSKEVGYSLLDAVRHASVVYGRIEQAAVGFRRIVALVATEHEGSIQEAVSVLFHLLNQGDHRSVLLCPVNLGCDSDRWFPYEADDTVLFCWTCLSFYLEFEPR